MNYTVHLTEQEKDTLCGIIGGKEFKILFNKKSKEFSKIKHGFRAKTLSDSEALSTAVQNINKPFIELYVNIIVETWLKEIRDNIEKLQNEGFSPDDALASTLVDSFFCYDINLYFKLIEQPIDTVTYEMLTKKMDSIKISREKNSEMADRVKAMEDENNRLLSQVESIQMSLETAKTECVQKIKSIEQEKSALEALLIEAQNQITELQTAPTEVMSDNPEYLALFDDTDSTALPAVDSDETVSLCGVSTDYNGQPRLIRHADLSHSGHYHIFHRRDDIPPYYSNRDKIFHRDGPSDDGFYGIWTWSAIPNEKDNTKDYIVSHYNKNIDAIEIVTVTSASSLEELVLLLKDGIEYQPHSNRVMFALHTPQGQYIGILCKNHDIKSVNGKVAFADDFISAPVYEFAEDDSIHLANGLSFYRNAFLGIPNILYQVKSPIDIVKNIVLSSISWAAYKSRGLTRAEYKTFKDFLGVIPIDDITEKIELACHCSHPAAEKLLTEFIDVVWRYVDGDSLEDEVILSAISASDELKEKTKELIRSDWEAENEALLTEAHNELSGLDIQLSEANANLVKAKKALKQAKVEEERLIGIIAEKGKLAEDVEIAVADRIQRARENVAEFLANMAFVGGHPVKVAAKEVVQIEETSTPTSTQYHVVGAFSDPDDLEAHNTWANVIDTATNELEEAGVAKQYSRGLATFLCAAYIEKQPILLVGPNALDIIQAFSAAATGHKYGILCCEGGISSQSLKEIGSNGENIVAINNLLTSGWMNRLPELLSQKNIFYIATHPYAEDIQVEPKSMYGFLLPLFTEFFVDKTATGKYIGGYFVDNFEAYMAPEGTRKEVKALTHLAMSALIRNRINSLVTTMHEINSAATSDDDFLFAVLPITYATMAIDDLSTAISDPQGGISISANLRRDLQYVLGEA